MQRAMAMRQAYIILVGKNLLEKEHLRDMDVDRVTILNWILKKQCIKVWSGCNWHRTGTDGGLS
jgi:hypothetical protein